MEPTIRLVSQTEQMRTKTELQKNDFEAFKDENWMKLSADEKTSLLSETAKKIIDHYKYAYFKGKNMEYPDIVIGEPHSSSAYLVGENTIQLQPELFVSNQQNIGFHALAHLLHECVHSCQEDYFKDVQNLSHESAYVRSIYYDLTHHHKNHEEAMEAYKNKHPNATRYPDSFITMKMQGKDVYVPASSYISPSKFRDTELADKARTLYHCQPCEIQANLFAHSEFDRVVEIFPEVSGLENLDLILRNDDQTECLANHRDYFRNAVTIAQMVKIRLNEYEGANYAIDEEIGKLYEDLQTQTSWKNIRGIENVHLCDEFRSKLDYDLDDVAFICDFADTWKSAVFQKDSTLSDETRRDLMDKLTAFCNAYRLEPDARDRGIEESLVVLTARFEREAGRDVIAQFLVTEKDWEGMQFMGLGRQFEAKKLSEFGKIENFKPITENPEMEIA